MNLNITVNNKKVETFEQINVDGSTGAVRYGILFTLSTGNIPNQLVLE